MPLTLDEAQIALERMREWPLNVPENYWAHTLPGNIAGSVSRCADLLGRSPECRGYG